MRAFHAVATAGSFTAAAKALHVSQPPVTTHVKELEEHYGVELFFRHGRGTELTDVGRQLLAIVQRVVTNQTEATDFLKEAGKVRTGHLRFGAVAEFHLTEILALFCKRYPKIDITVSQGNSRALIDDLRNYRSDIAIVGQVGQFEEFEAIRFARPEIKVIVHRDHAWAERESIGIHELQGEPLVFREEGSETRRVLEQAASKAGVKLTKALLFHSREGLIAAVARGLGVGALAEEQFAALDMLRRLRVHDADLRTEVHVLCLRERSESRLIRAFMDVVAELVAARPAGDQAHG